MKYVQPYDQPLNPAAPYVDLNAPQGIDGSIPPSAFFNVVQAEILNVITYAGLTPNATQLNQLLLAILALMPHPTGGPSDASLVHWGIDSGTTNAIILTPSPTVTTVAPGFTISFVPLNTSTGPTTVEIILTGGNAVENLLRADLQALIPGVDVVAGKRMTIIFDGTQFYTAGSQAPYTMRLESLGGPGKVSIIGGILTAPPSGASGLWVPDPRARTALVFATGGGGGGGSAVSGGNGQGGGAGGTDIALVPLLGITGIPWSIGIGGNGGVGAGNDGGDGTQTSFGTWAQATGGQGGFGVNGQATDGSGGTGQMGQLRVAGNPGQEATGGNQSGSGGPAFWGGGGFSGSVGFRALPATDAAPGQTGGGGGGGVVGGPTGNGGRGGDGVILVLTA
jgi:hypothetical protein